MKIKQILLTSLLTFTITVGLHAATPSVKTVTIAAYDTMNYSVKKIEAHPGQKLVVVLKNEGTIPKNGMMHNWILLKAGVDPKAYAEAALKANELQPSALADEVIASVPALGPNESGTASFTAPAVPGTYHYLCTAIGHIMGGTGTMRGVLIVH